MNEFSCDGILGYFGVEKSSKVMRSTLRPLVDHFTDGGNSTVISYGQKRLGKTRLLTTDEEGVIPQFLKILFVEKKVDRIEVSITRVANNSVGLC